MKTLWQRGGYIMSMLKVRIGRNFVSILIAALIFTAAATVEAQTTRGAYVTTSDVQVRRGPGTNHEVVATIPQGIKVNVVGREGYWLRIESKQGNQPGYIDEQYARPLETTQSTKQVAPSVKGVYVTTSDVDLRSGPGPNYKVVKKIPEGIKVHVVGAEGEWLRVESKHGNQPGYIEKRFAVRQTR